MRIKDYLYDHETSMEGAQSLGTGEGAPEPGSSAGTENTDTSHGNGPPETVPYSRFKEVNDQLGELRDFKPLRDVGYDADSLRSLVEFEASFRANPTQTWLSVAEQIEELPPELKDAIKKHAGGPPSSSSPPASGKTEGGEERPSWAQELYEKVSETDKRLSAREQADQSAANSQMLDNLMADWRKADEAAGLKSPGDSSMLTFIMAHANSGTASTLGEILEAARGEWMTLREETLDSTIRPGSSGAPRSVPGGGAPANAAGSPKTLAEATQRAKLRIEQAQ